MPAGPIAKIRQFLQKVFFWHEQRKSSEFTPSQAHDHALVLQVTESKKLPKWKQIRYAGLVLTLKEKRVVFLTVSILILGIAATVWSIMQDRMVNVPTDGGKFSEAIVGSPKSINPLYAPANDPDADLSALIYSGLFKRSGWNTIEPDLASEYHWSDDGKQLTIKIREHVYFHDGAELSADDVIFTLEAAKDPSWHSMYLSALRNITVERKDERTIVISLTEPDATILNALTIGILPTHLWQDVTPSNATLADASIKPVGTGPYRIRSFRQNANGSILAYTLEHNDKYYGTEPNIHQIEFRFYPDHKSAEDALRGGQIDTLAFVTAQQAAKLSGDQLKTSQIQLPQLTLAFLNMNDPILKDARVRQALELATDRSAVAEAQANLAVPIFGPYPYSEQRQNTSSTEELLSSARSLLDAAGWKIENGSEVRVKSATATSTEKQQLSFSLTVPNIPDLISVASTLQRQWSVLGIKINLDIQTPESLIGNLNQTRNAPVIVWNILLGPTQDLYPIWWSGETTGKGLNLSGLKDKDVDDGIKAVRLATSTQAIAAAQENLSKAILNRHPAVFLTRPSYGYVHSKRIKGMPEKMEIGLPSDRFSSIKDWYVKTGWRWK